MQFNYEIRTIEGDTTSGQIEADSLADAIVQLQVDGAEVLSIQQANESSEAWSGPISRHSVASDSVASIYAPPMSIDESTIERLEAFAKELPRGGSRKELQKLASAIRGGANIEQLANHNPVWLPLLAKLPAEGSELSLEQTGNSFVSAVSYGNRARSRVMRTLAYPVCLLILTICVLAPLCWQIVPIFDRMFDEFGLRLPAPTRLLLALSNEFQSGRIFLWIGVLIVILAIATWAFTSPDFRYRVLGRPSRRSRRVGLANFVHYLTSLLGSGMDLENSLRTTARFSNGYYRDVAESLVRNIATRQSPAPHLLPPNVVLALGLNELESNHEPQPNVALLNELSMIYRGRLNESESYWLEALSAVAIILVGLLVGFAVIALLLPVVSLVSGLS